ncbi:MAG TPA: hypothetical protein VNC50_20225 [Planctomycetia bacterium]|nr:hypothetical protein [Planctomycetia bacterium]
MRTFALAFAALAAAAIPARAELESGPKVGSDVAPFHIVDVTGGAAGKEHCYRCEYGDNPVVAIFATEINDKIVKACKELDGQIGASKDLKGFFVFLTDDVAAAKTKLTEVAKTNGLKNLPLTVYEGKAGPKDFSLSKDAGVTLVCWKDSSVKMTAAYAPGKFCDHCAKGAIAKFTKGETKTEKAGG